MCVEAKVVEPQTEYFGEEQYPGLFLKAAVYFYKLATSHCFLDGNKRASVISTDLFLKFNGYKFSVEQSKIFEFSRKLTNHKTRPELCEVETWIRTNTIPFDLEGFSNHL